MKCFLPWCALLLLVLVNGTPEAAAAAEGGIGTGTFKASPPACVGQPAFASVSGLEGFELAPQGQDGAAGTEYSGGDDFVVDSNVPVWLYVEGSRMNNGQHSLATAYTLDGMGHSTNTQGAGQPVLHRVDAAVVLGGIAEQSAGKYSSTVTVTVVSELAFLPCRG